MKKLAALLLFLVSLNSYSAETIVQPSGTAVKSATKNILLQTAQGNRVNAMVNYVSDGNGNIIPAPSAALLSTIEQHLAPFSYSHLTGNGTTTVKSGSGVLGSICVNNNNDTGTFTIYDNTTATGSIVGVISSAGETLVTHGPVCLEYNVIFSTGLTVVTASSSGNDITVTYK